MIDLEPIKARIAAYDDIDVDGLPIDEHVADRLGLDGWHTAVVDLHKHAPTDLAALVAEVERLRSVMRDAVATLQFSKATHAIHSHRKLVEALATTAEAEPVIDKYGQRLTGSLDARPSRCECHSGVWDGICPSCRKKVEAQEAAQEVK